VGANVIWAGEGGWRGQQHLKLLAVGSAWKDHE